MRLWKSETLGQTGGESSLMVTWRDLYLAVDILKDDRCLKLAKQHLPVMLFIMVKLKVDHPLSESVFEILSTKQYFRVVLCY